MQICDDAVSSSKRARFGSCTDGRVKKKKACLTIRHCSVGKGNAQCMLNQTGTSQCTCSRTAHLVLQNKWHIAFFLAWHKTVQQHRKAADEGLSDGAWPSLANDHVAGCHPLRHVVHKALDGDLQCGSMLEHGCERLGLHMHHRCGCITTACMLHFNNPDIANILQGLLVHFEQSTHCLLAHSARHPPTLLTFLRVLLFNDQVEQTFPHWLPHHAWTGHPRVVPVSLAGPTGSRGTCIPAGYCLASRRLMRPLLRPQMATTWQAGPT